MTKQRKLFLKAPEGMKVRRHHIGGESQEIRFTTPGDGFQKLVGVAKGDKFTWLHKDFRNR